MKFLSIAEMAKKWQMSERSVRYYCQQGRVSGAVLSGGKWQIPDTAPKPTRTTKSTLGPSPLLTQLREEKSSGMSGGIYHKTQVELTYNTNHMEGSRLSQEQTRFIFETNTIGLTDQAANVDDIIETSNHFRCVDLIIDCAEETLSEKLIKQLHFILKSGTSDARKSWFNVGDYKQLPNEVADQPTTLPENVGTEMKKHLNTYRTKKAKTLEDIIDFHVNFERIHPFQDGNGRIGRLIMFKECLRYHLVPFIIEEQVKFYYYRGLSEWGRTNGYLLDTCLAAQDRYKTYLDYFRIPYNHE